MLAPLSDGQLTLAMLEGYGSVVLVNGHTQSDRAMLLSVRPPSYGSSVFRDFASGTAKGDRWTEREGTANLLQAQVGLWC